MKRLTNCCAGYKLLCFFLLSLSTLNLANGQTNTMELPKEKQTTLGLYVTAKEAYEKWKASPDKVKILDVRTMEEYINIGHAEMAWNITAFLQTFDWDAEKKHFAMKNNPDFMTQIKEVFKPDDIILVTCRSGGRSALAANQLAAAGFKNVYNITDGMEGDLVDDPQSLYAGKRMMNGWKNAGLPWTYAVDPKLILVPKVK
jgi:rhodanese-related sulfurtransferase